MSKTIRTLTVTPPRAPAALRRFEDAEIIASEGVATEGLAGRPQRASGAQPSAASLRVFSLAPVNSDWANDRVSFSERTRALFDRAVAPLVRAVSFWDQAVIEVPIGGRVLRLDLSGTYALDH